LRERPDRWALPLTRTRTCPRTSTAIAKLTDQQKLLARIALITEGLKYAQGDLANTIGEYANQTRKAAGDWRT